jgi:hypothetical protein
MVFLGRSASRHGFFISLLIVEVIRISGSEKRYAICRVQGDAGQSFQGMIAFRAPEELFRNAAVDALLRPNTPVLR